eukprot:GDKJ01016920.1.p1 GENE.GDKJ01016920.1~~GDKJ01016920.1.p1  ORF type:complete len:494 (+),score=115.01 GDKJ01016920.1:132-1484(+)
MIHHQNTIMQNLLSMHNTHQHNHHPSLSSNHSLLFTNPSSNANAVSTQHTSNNMSFNNNNNNNSNACHGESSPHLPCSSLTAPENSNHSHNNHTSVPAQADASHQHSRVLTDLMRLWKHKQELHNGWTIKKEMISRGCELAQFWSISEILSIAQHCLNNLNFVTPIEPCPSEHPRSSSSSSSASFSATSLTTNNNNNNNASTISLLQQQQHQHQVPGNAQTLYSQQNKTISYPGHQTFNVERQASCGQFHHAIPAPLPPPFHPVVNGSQLHIPLVISSSSHMLSCSHFTRQDELQLQQHNSAPRQLSPPSFGSQFNPNNLDLLHDISFTLRVISVFLVRGPLSVKHEIEPVVIHSDILRQSYLSEIDRNRAIGESYLNPELQPLLDIWETSRLQQIAPGLRDEVFCLKTFVTNPANMAWDMKKGLFLKYSTSRIRNFFSENQGIVSLLGN